MIVKVKDNIFGEVINEYTNGYDTTAGFIDKENLLKVNTTSITYNSKHYTCLPVEWPDLLWLDDLNKVQKIKDIIFKQDCKAPYIMENGYKSSTVTLYYRLIKTEGNKYGM